MVGMMWPAGSYWCGAGKQILQSIRKHWCQLTREAGRDQQGVVQSMLGLERKVQQASALLPEMQK